MSNPPYTIFACPKAFRGQFDRIQKNSIKSWLALDPQPEIILLGDDDGTREVAEKLGLIHIPDIEKSQKGVPKVSSVFRKAQEAASGNPIAYVNSDIILTSDFSDTIERVCSLSQFLLVGQRTDVKFDRRIVTSDKGGLDKSIFQAMNNQGSLHSKTGIDYFVFPKGLYSKMPDFVIGRTVWDHWLVYKAWDQGAKVIDATLCNSVFHQDHSYISDGDEFDPWETKEALLNLELAGGYHNMLDIRDATHVLTKNDIKKVPFTKTLTRALKTTPYITKLIRKIV